MVTRLEAFFAGYLGGRAQTEVSPEVAAQIKVLEVDPATGSGKVEMKGALAAKS